MTDDIRSIPTTAMFQPVFSATDRFPFAHASTIQLLNGGRRLACAWFSGSLEGHEDVGIRLSFLDALETGTLSAPTWSDPRLIVDERGVAAGNPVFFRPGEDVLLMFYTRFPPRDARNAQIRVMRSEDGGVTWSASSAIDRRGGYWPRHSVHVARDGAWLLPVCNVDDRPPLSMVWRSTDSGETWQEVAIPMCEYLIQPAIVPLSGGTLGLFLRDMKCRSIFRSVSTDHGRSWSPPTATALPNNNSGFSMVTLRDGRLLAAYNDGCVRMRRSRISIALSEDDGTSWPIRRPITPFNDLHASRGQISYPFLALDEEDRVHMSLTYQSHTIQHIAFSVSFVSETGIERLAVPAGELSTRPVYDLRRVRQGEAVYLADKATLLEAVPAALDGALTICPARPDMLGADDGTVTLLLNRAARLYIAADTRRDAGDGWLDGFRETGWTASTTAAGFSLLQRAVDPGEFIIAEQPGLKEGFVEPWFGFILEATDGASEDS